MGSSPFAPAVPEQSISYCPGGIPMNVTSSRKPLSSPFCCSKRGLCSAIKRCFLSVNLMVTISEKRTEEATKKTAMENVSQNQMLPDVANLQNVQLPGLCSRYFQERNIQKRGKGQMYIKAVNRSGVCYSKQNPRKWAKHSAIGR